ncbi:hypothetical protein [Sulfurimonas sp.]|uniref:hypothetical protein n=1 Tax=Sulfurimonas sp. TaxID=2022749 RepID=UPI003D0E7B43
MIKKTLMKDLSIQVNVLKGPKYTAKSLNFGTVEAIKGDQIYLFTELVNAFVTNRLKYKKWYKIDECDIRIVSNDGEKKLYIKTIFKKYGAGEDVVKEYKFEKYECSTLVRMINKILSKCTFFEFVD